MRQNAPKAPKARSNCFKVEFYIGLANLFLFIIIQLPFFGAFDLLAEKYLEKNILDQKQCSTLEEKGQILFLEIYTRLKICDLEEQVIF